MLDAFGASSVARHGVARLAAPLPARWDIDIEIAIGIGIEKRKKGLLPLGTRDYTFECRASAGPL